MKFWARKVTASGRDYLVPVDGASTGIFAKIPFSKDIETETRQPRNPQFHRMVFVLVNRLAEAFDEEPENVRHQLCVRIGWYEEIVCIEPDGSRRIDRRPKSWSFAKMDQQQFRALFDDLVKATYAIWGILPADIRREINDILKVQEPTR